MTEQDEQNTPGKAQAIHEYRDIRTNAGNPASQGTWTQLNQFRQEFSQLYPNARLANRLDANRQEHEDNLSGSQAGGDIHA